MKKQYGYADTGAPIVAPAGWKILSMGEAVPQVHREATEDGIWCQPRRCHGTMTAPHAGVSGYVRAIAVPVDYDPIPQEASDFTFDGFQIRYYRRCTGFNMNLLECWSGGDWKMVGTLPWGDLQPINREPLVPAIA